MDRFLECRYVPYSQSQPLVQLVLRVVYITDPSTTLIGFPCSLMYIQLAYLVHVGSFMASVSMKIWLDQAVCYSNSDGRWDISGTTTGSDQTRSAL